MATALTTVSAPVIGEVEHRKRFIERMERKLAYKQALHRYRRQLLLVQLRRPQQKL
jgi:hypothetical protein